jgi:hypothetical protein
MCDAINNILKNTKPDDVITEVQVKKLKIRIAAALNKIFKASEEPKKEGDKDKKEDSKKDEKSSDEPSKKDSEPDSESGSKKKEAKIPNDWDSAEGPIYQVFFKTLATQ